MVQHLPDVDPVLDLGQRRLRIMAGRDANMLEAWERVDRNYYGFFSNIRRCIFIRRRNRRCILTRRPNEGTQSSRVVRAVGFVVGSAWGHLRARLGGRLDAEPEPQCLNAFLLLAYHHTPPARQF